MNEISVWCLCLQVFPSTQLTDFPPPPPIVVGVSSSIYGDSGTLNTRNRTMSLRYFPVSRLCKPPSSSMEIGWCDLAEFALQGHPVFAGPN